MHNVVSREHFEMARRFRALYSKYEKGRDLVQIGAYAHGSDPMMDEAIALNGPMREFLQQGMHEAAPMDSVIEMMAMVTNARRA